MNSAQFVSAWINSNKRGISVKLSGKQTCYHIKIHAALWTLYFNEFILLCLFQAVRQRTVIYNLQSHRPDRMMKDHFFSLCQQSFFHLFSYSLFIVCPWHHQSPGSTVYKHCFGWQKINWSANDVKSIKFLQSCILKPLFRLIHSLGNILLLRNRFFPPHSLLRARCISFNLSAVKGWPTSKSRRD